MVHEPASRMADDLLKRTWFFEEMASLRNDDKLLLTGHARQCMTIEVEHNLIGAADDQQRWRLHFRQSSGGKIRSPASRYNGCYALPISAAATRAAAAPVLAPK